MSWSASAHLAGGTPIAERAAAIHARRAGPGSTPGSAGTATIWSDNVGRVPVAIRRQHGERSRCGDMVTDPVQRIVVERQCDCARPMATSRPRLGDEGAACGMERRGARRRPAAAAICAPNRNRRHGEARSALSDRCDPRASGWTSRCRRRGRRAGPSEGPVTKGTIYEVMPFDNRVFTLEITGADIRTALEQALRSERVTQVSGIKYTFDLGAPAGQRVQSLTLANGQPLDEQRTYKVACNDFMATGGDDYSVLSGGKNRLETDLRVRDVLEQMVMQLTKAGKPVDYQPKAHDASERHSQAENK